MTNIAYNPLTGSFLLVPKGEVPVLESPEATLESFVFHDHVSQNKTSESEFLYPVPYEPRELSEEENENFMGHVLEAQTRCGARHLAYVMKLRVDQVARLGSHGMKELRPSVEAKHQGHNDPIFCLARFLGYDSVYRLLE